MVRKTRYWAEQPWQGDPLHKGESAGMSKLANKRGYFAAGDVTGFA